MCTRPLTAFSKPLGREITMACRTCDACVATRRHNWVARAMAEKAMHPQTFVVTLTYADDTQFNRDGARFFRYDDVRLFLARVRDAIKQATEQVAALRFIAAGEQGSRNGRCHWHIVLYSDVDLLSIGKFAAPWGEVTKSEDIVAPMGKDMPRSWTMWPHGFVQVQVPDAGGMHYALSYALKDQFSVAKSSGSARINRAEEFATGLFRMSKNPPIGAPWIDEFIYERYCSGNVIPNTQLQVPGMFRYWFPSGPLRIRLLQGLRRVNQSFVVQHGRNCATWTTLVNSCKENDSDLDALGMLVEDQDETSIETQIQFRQRERTQAAKDAEIRRRCGRRFPCEDCLRGLPDADLARLGLRFEGASLYRADGTPYNEKDHNQIASGINGDCGLAATPSRKRAFPQSAAE